MDKFKDMRILYEEETVNEDTIEIRKLEMAFYKKRGNKVMIFLSLVMFASLFLSFLNIKLIEFTTASDTANTITRTVEIKPANYVLSSFRYLFNDENELEDVRASFMNDSCSEGLLEGAREAKANCLSNPKVISAQIAKQYTRFQGLSYSVVILLATLGLIISPIIILVRAYNNLNKETNMDFTNEKYFYLLPLFSIIILLATVLNSNLFGFSSKESIGLGALIYAVTSVAVVIAALLKNRLGNDPTRKVAKIDTEIKTSLINYMAIIIAVVLLMLPLFKVVINTKGLAIGGEYQSYMYLNEKLSFIGNEKDFEYRTIRRVRTELGIAYFNVDKNEYHEELETYAEGSGWIEILYQSDIDNHLFVRYMGSISYYASRILIFGFLLGIFNIFGGAFYGKGTISRLASLIIIFSGLVYVSVNFLNKAILIFTGNGLEDAAFQYTTSLSSYFIILSIVFIIFFNSLSSNNSRIISSYNPMM